MVYKTASDTLNYVNERRGDVDSTATAVVFLPLIHLSSPSYHLLSPPSPSPAPSLRSKPSTVKMDLSKPCLKARGRALCAQTIVFVGEGEKVVPHSMKNSHISNWECWIKEEKDEHARCSSCNLDLEQPGFVSRRIFSNNSLSVLVLELFQQFFSVVFPI